MALTVDALFMLDLPASWRGMDHPAGVVFASEDEWQVAEGRPEALRTSIFFGLLSVPEGMSVAHYVDRKMVRHVPVGMPEEFAWEVDGRSARAFEWTDGVTNILSFYFGLAPRLIFLIEVAEPFREDGGCGDLHALAKDILARLHWAPSLDDLIAREGPRPICEPMERCFTVWREDDNGIRVLVSDGHTLEEANRTLARFERLTHKQTYWITADRKTVD